MVGGCRPNVVDGPVSWREAPGAAGVEPDERAAAAPPSRGARPAGLVGHRGAQTPQARQHRPRGRGTPPPPESFSKIVLASLGEFPYSTFSHGGVAQLGERLTGSQEVRGSIPLVSTIVNAKAFGIPKAFFMSK